MRYVPGPAALAVLFFAGPCFAEPDLRTVIAETAEARALPSTSRASYVTNRLRRGATVEVVEAAEGGWVKVRPPAGSFSWINARFLQHVVPDPDLPNHVVSFEDSEVPVLIGSDSAGDVKPTVAQVKLKRGAQVISLGPVKQDAEGGRWMRIEPPPGEVRYLPASALGPRGAAASDGVTGSKDKGPLSLSVAPSADIRASAVDLWYQAQRAEQTGQMREAIRLYRLAAMEATPGNPALASQANARISWLEAGAGLRPADPGVRPGLNTPVAIGASAGGSSFTRAPALARPAGSNWRAYRGRLQRAGRTDFPDITHRLEVRDQYGMWSPFAYLRPAPGVSLAPLADQGEVEVQGEVTYQGDLKTWVMYVRRAGVVSP